MRNTMQRLSAVSFLVFAVGAGADNAVRAPQDVNVLNFPATQAVNGSVSVSNFPSTQTVGGTVAVSNFPSSQTVSGTVSVDNFPGTVGVDVLTLPPTVIGGDGFIAAYSRAEFQVFQPTPVPTLPEDVERRVVGYQVTLETDTLGTRCLASLFVGRLAFRVVLASSTEKVVSQTVMLPLPIRLTNYTRPSVVSTRQAGGGSCDGNVDVYYEYAY